MVPLLSGAVAVSFELSDRFARSLAIAGVVKSVNAATIRICRMGHLRVRTPPPSELINTCGHETDVTPGGRSGAQSHVGVPRQSDARRRRRAFVITDTELRLMAA